MIPEDIEVGATYICVDGYNRTVVSIIPENFRFTGNLWPVDVTYVVQGTKSNMVIHRTRSVRWFAEKALRKLDT